MILIKSAFYGRMKVGRCLPNDFGNIGCQADVLSILDEDCTGKSACNVAVIDRRIIKQKGYLT